MATPFFTWPGLLGSYFEEPLELLEDHIALREAMKKEKGREKFYPRIDELKDVRAARILGLFS